MPVTLFLPDTKTQREKLCQFTIVLIDMHSVLQLRSIFLLQQHSKWGVYVISSYGNTPVLHASHRILSNPGVFSWFFYGIDSHHIQGSEHSVALSCSIFWGLFYIAIWWQYSFSFTRSALEDKNVRKSKGRSTRLGNSALPCKGKSALKRSGESRRWSQTKCWKKAAKTLLRIISVIKVLACLFIFF